MKFNSSLLFWILKIGVLLVTGKMTYQFSNSWFYGDWFVVYGLLIVVNVGEYFSARATVLAANGFAKAFFATLAIMAASISIMGSFGYMLIADEMAKLQQAYEQKQERHRETASQLANQAMSEVDKLPSSYKSRRAAGAIDVLESYTDAVGNTGDSTAVFASVDQQVAAIIVTGIARGVSRITTQNEHNAKYTVVLFIALFIELMVIGIAIFEAMDDRNTGDQLGIDDDGTRHILRHQRMQLTPETLQLLVNQNGSKSDSAVTVTHEIELLIKEFTEDKDFEDPFFNPIRAQQTLELCYHMQTGDKVPWAKIAGIVGVKPQSVQNLWKRYNQWLSGKKVSVNGAP